MGDLTSEYNPVLAPVAIKPRTELFGDMLRFMLKSYHKEIDLIEVYQIASKVPLYPNRQTGSRGNLKNRGITEYRLEDYLIACEKVWAVWISGDKMLGWTY